MKCLTEVCGETVVVTLTGTPKEKERWSRQEVGMFTR